MMLTAMQSQYQVRSGFFLHFVVAQSAAIFQLVVSELRLIRVSLETTSWILDLCLDISKSPAFNRFFLLLQCSIYLC